MHERLISFGKIFHVFYYNNVNRYSRPSLYTCIDSVIPSAQYYDYRTHT